MSDLAAELQANLAQRAAGGADAAEIGRIAVLAWRGIEAALSPIIGRGGVSALFERSLYLVAVSHPALIVAHDDAALSGNFVAIGRVLSGSAGVDAAVAHGALIGAFHGLLTGLIGAPLTDRLLQPVWDTLQSGDPAKDDAS